MEYKLLFILYILINLDMIFFRLINRKHFCLISNNKILRILKFNINDCNQYYLNCFFFLNIKKIIK